MTAVNLYVCVCMYIYCIYMYLSAQVSMQIENLRLCPIRVLPLCVPAAFPLKFTMLTAAAEEEFFLTQWLPQLLTFPEDAFEVFLFFFFFLSTWQLLSTAIRVHKATTDTLTQLFEQTHETQIDTRSQTLFFFFFPPGWISVEWREERDRHK